MPFYGRLRAVITENPAHSSAVYYHLHLILYFLTTSFHSHFLPLAPFPPNGFYGSELKGYKHV